MEHESTTYHVLRDLFGNPGGDPLMQPSDTATLGQSDQPPLSRRPGPRRVPGGQGAGTPSVASTRHSEAVEGNTHI